SVLHVRLAWFNDTSPTEIYTLSLHDALPIYDVDQGSGGSWRLISGYHGGGYGKKLPSFLDQFWRSFENETGLLLDPVYSLKMFRSEEHTSELQSRENLVCRLLLEKKKQLNRF